MPKNQEKIKRTRVRTGPIKKWTDEEGLSMIYYILDKQNDGKPFEVVITYILTKNQPVIFFLN